MFLIKKDFWLDCLFFVAGSVIFAFSVNVFTAPSNIAPGGITGLATMLNYLTNLPIGLLIFILNIPLFIWGCIVSGIKNMHKTLAATLLTSFAIDALEPVMPVFIGDMFLVTVCGGVLSGLGLSLIFMRNGTTGGSDLAANLLMKKFPHLSMGRLLLIIDLGVVVLSALVYRNIQLPLYAAVVIFIASKVVDTVLYGTNIGNGKILFIISDKNEIIAENIMKKMARGVTKLSARGGYTGKEGCVLMCALRRAEIAKAGRIIHEIDRDAFTVVAEAGEITGEGFLERK